MLYIVNIKTSHSASNLNRYQLSSHLDSDQERNSELAFTFLVIADSKYMVTIIL